jgi:hypothetical protein
LHPQGEEMCCYCICPEESIANHIGGELIEEGIIRNVHMFPGATSNIKDETNTDETFVVIFFAELEDFPSIRMIVK